MRDLTIEELEKIENQLEISRYKVESLVKLLQEIDNRDINNLITIIQAMRQLTEDQIKQVCRR